MPIMVTRGSGANQLVPNVHYGRTFSDIMTKFGAARYSLYDFRPGANSTVYSDNAGSVIITTAGVPVANVRDMGTNARHLTKPAPGQRPNTGHNGLAFDGSDKTLTSSTGRMDVKTVVAVFSSNTSYWSYEGIITNHNDGSANVDFIYVRNVNGPEWDITQGVGNGLADKDHMWINGAVDKRISPERGRLVCYSADATGFVAANTNFPQGLKVGNDRNNGSRNWAGNLAALFIHSDSILSDADRCYVEYTFNHIYGLGMTN